MPSAAELDAALRHRLLPVVPIAGLDERAAMAARLAHYACPGVGVTVLEDGAPVWSAGFGELEAGSARPVLADTVFGGASISKPVTAVLVMQQVERGRLDLDVDVNRYLKTWRLPDNEFTRARPVTLRHLLSHRAGTTVHGFGGMPPNAALPTSLDTLRGRAPAHNAAVTVDKTPGGTVRYSGGGYTVVQLLLEELTGRPYAQLAREMVLEPLGMTDATFEPVLPAAITAKAAVGHDAVGRALPEKWPCCAQQAAGGLYTSVTDFARFIGDFRNAYVGRATPLLSTASARTMLAARTDGDGEGGFALGWRVLGEGSAMRISHGGSNGGYQCESTCYLDSGQGAVVMTNAVSGAVFYWELLNTLAEACGWPGFLPLPKVLLPWDEDSLARHVGRYAVAVGVDAAFVELSSVDGQLLTHIAGLRAPPVATLRDSRGRLFNRFSPYEIDVVCAADGLPIELLAREGGTIILRARRVGT